MPQEQNSTVPKVIPDVIKTPNLTPDELEDRNHDIMIMRAMQFDRDRAHPELDGMTHIEYYESNRKKDLSYLPPKTNKQDIRITSGLTREKDTTLLSTLLSMNFVPTVTAFDKDDLVVNELGDNMGDLVKKTREIENWQKKRPIIYRELIAQGDVFVQEMYVEDFREMPLDQVNWEPTTDKIADFSIRTRLQKLFSGCAVRMVNAKKIYVGNTRLEYIEDQDAVAVLNIYSRQAAYSRYAIWERWANIPTALYTMNYAWDGKTYKDWNLVTLNNEGMVAEIMLYQPKKNRFQIYLNGTPMLPAKFPMTAICPSGELPLAQGKLEPISDFYLSKSQPSKIKIDQEVLDETTKLMVEGMRQGRKPPLGSRGKKVLSPSIFIAGKVTPDIKEGDVFPLYDKFGLNTADFSFYNLIKTGIEEKTINKAYEGDTKDVNTLGQAQQDKEQQMLKLGSSLDGVINLERRLTWLRIYNFIENMTKKYDAHVDSIREGIDGQYRKFTVNTALENGQKGIKLFRLQTDKYPAVADQQKEEKQLEDKYGQEVRIVYMNPEMLRSIKYSWFIIIVPTPSSNDLLTQLMFIQNVEKAIEIFGPESINADYLKQRFSVLIHEDYNKFFKKMTVQDMLAQQNGGLSNPAAQNAMGNGAGAGGPKVGLSAGTKRPVVATH